jgi:hypothetical protein
MSITILKSNEVGQVRYSLPKSLVSAAGMLKGKVPDGVRYQKQIRKEWEKRLGKLTSKK